MPVRQLGALILAVLLPFALDNTTEDEKTLADAGLKSDGNSLIQFLARRSEDKFDPEGKHRPFSNKFSEILLPK